MKKKWYLANVLVYRILSKKSTIVYWENLVLIKAGSPYFAYKKAMNYGKDFEEKYFKDGHKVEWNFAGIKDLVEVFSIGDEEELTYKEGTVRNISQIKRMIPLKEKLGVFTFEKLSRKDKFRDGNAILKFRQRS